MKSNTAGPIFTLSGVIANSVHGGYYGEGYIFNTVVGLRVAVVA